MRKRSLITIFTIIFVDLLGFGLILPLIPFYAERFGASATVAGFLIASYAAAQLIGSPFLGQLSDKYGRRPVLLISILGTTLGFILLAVAIPLGKWLADFTSVMDENSFILTLLFISRILDGLTGGNISVARAYITDVTDESNRAMGMGLIGAAFGLGFVIGPAMGGLLSVYGYAVPALVAAALSTLNLFGTFMWLPESLTEEIRDDMAKQPKPKLNFTRLRYHLQRKRVGPLLQIRFYFSLAVATLHTIFPLYAEHHLGLDERATSYILAYVGMLIVLVQGVAIRRLAKIYTDNQLIVFSAILMSPSLLGWAFAPNVTVLLIVLAPIALASGLFNTALNSAISKSVHKEEVGETLGISSSLESLTRVIAPAAGGFLLQKLGTSSPGLFGAIIVAILVPFIWKKLIANPDQPLSVHSEIVG